MALGPFSVALLEPGDGLDLTSVDSVLSLYTVGFTCKVHLICRASVMPRMLGKSVRPLQLPRLEVCASKVGHSPKQRKRVPVRVQRGTKEW